MRYFLCPVHFLLFVVHFLVLWLKCWIYVYLCYQYLILLVYLSLGHLVWISSSFDWNSVACIIIYRTIVYNYFSYFHIHLFMLLSFFYQYFYHWHFFCLFIAPLSFINIVIIIFPSTFISSFLFNSDLCERTKEHFLKSKYKISPSLTHWKIKQEKLMVFLQYLAN